MVTCANTVQIWTTAKLPYLLIPLKTIAVEKVSLSGMENLRTVFNPFIVDNKYSLLNRGNLLQYFQMQLSQKRKTFPPFFFFFIFFIFLHFSNLDSIVNVFKEKMTHIVDGFLNSRTRKNLVC